MSTSRAEIFDTRVCKLGEGPLWHPERGQLFWFDILGRSLMSQASDGTQMQWSMGEHASAAGWTGRDTLLIATETSLIHFDVVTGKREMITPLDDENPVTRSNDGRADPWGGFWIGTMGKNTEPQAGAIYRLHQGTLRKLVDQVTISNAICFAPDHSRAYFTDTATKKVMTIALHPDTGWPDGDAQVHLDLGPEKLNPDGAVTDANGDLWLAEWGAARVSRYGADAGRVSTWEVPATQTTCPAFGGPDLRDLYVTSAAIGLGAAIREDLPHTGKAFVIRNAGQGRPEPKVIL